MIMLSIIKPIVPNLLPVLNGDTTLTTAWLTVLAFAGLSALILSRYSSERYKTNRTKTAIFFVAFALLISVLMLCFFGCSATTVKGIVFFLVLLQSSFEDVRVRECDDCLHILILVAALIGTGFSSLIGMILSAAFVFAVMMGTLLVTKDEIGGADIKLSVACAFLLGLKKGLLGLIAGLTLAVIVNAVQYRKNKNAGFPMIPYLAAGFMAAFFM